MTQRWGPQAFSTFFSGAPRAPPQCRIPHLMYMYWLPRVLEHDPASGAPGSPRSAWPVAQSTRGGIAAAGALRSSGLKLFCKSDSGPLAGWARGDGGPRQGRGCRPRRGRRPRPPARRRRPPQRAERRRCARAHDLCATRNYAPSRVTPQRLAQAPPRRLSSFRGWPSSTCSRTSSAASRGYLAAQVADSSGFNMHNESRKKTALRPCIAGWAMRALPLRTIKVNPCCHHRAHR